MAPTPPGKTDAHTDTYHGHFAKLIENEQVVEVLGFETADPAMSGEMTVTPRSPMQTARRTSWSSTTGYQQAYP